MCDHQQDPAKQPGGGSQQPGGRGASKKATNLPGVAPHEAKHVIRPHGNRKKREITFENVRKVGWRGMCCGLGRVGFVRLLSWQGDLGVAGVQPADQ